MSFLKIIESPTTTKSQISIYLAFGIIIAILTFPFYSALVRSMAGITSLETPIDPITSATAFAAVASGIAGVLNVIRPDKIADLVIRTVAEVDRPREYFKRSNREPDKNLLKLISQIAVRSEIWEKNWWTSPRDDCHNAILGVMENRQIQSCLWTAKVDSAVGILLFLSMFPIYPHNRYLAVLIASLGLIISICSWLRHDIYFLYSRMRMVAVLGHAEDSFGTSSDQEVYVVRQGIAETDAMLAKGAWKRVETRYNWFEDELKKLLKNAYPNRPLTEVWALDFYKIILAKRQKEEYSSFVQHFLSTRDSFLLAKLIDESSPWAKITEKDCSSTEKFFDTISFEISGRHIDLILKGFKELTDESEKVKWINLITPKGNSLEDKYCIPFYSFACNYNGDDIIDLFFERIANNAGARISVGLTTKRVVKRFLELKWTTPGLEDLLFTIYSSNKVDIEPKVMIVRAATTHVKEGELATKIHHLHQINDQGDEDLQMALKELRQNLIDAGKLPK